MNFFIRNNIIILTSLFLFTGCNASKEVASSLKYEKADFECLFAFSDNQNCMVKRLSSSQLCRNF